MTINFRVEGIKIGLFLLLLLMAEIPNNHLAFFKNLYKKSDDWMNLYCILQMQNLIMIGCSTSWDWVLDFCYLSSLATLGLGYPPVEHEGIKPICKRKTRDALLSKPSYFEKY